jgi:hypothetical protein
VDELKETEYVEVEVRWYANFQIGLGIFLLAFAVASFFAGLLRGFIAALVCIPWGRYELRSGLRRRKEVGKELFRVRLGRTLHWTDYVGGKVQEVSLSDVRELDYWVGDGAPHIYIRMKNGGKNQFAPARFSHWTPFIEDLKRRFDGDFSVNGRRQKRSVGSRGKNG